MKKSELCQDARGWYEAVQGVHVLRKMYKKSKARTLSAGCFRLSIHPGSTAAKPRGGVLYFCLVFCCLKWKIVLYAGGWQAAYIGT